MLTLKTCISITLTVGAAVAGTWLATLNHGPSARSAATTPVAMALTPNTPRVTARTLTGTPATVVAPRSTEQPSPGPSSIDLSRRIATLEDQLEALLEAVAAAQGNGDGAPSLAEGVAASGEDYAAELDQQTDTGKAQMERHFQQALERHRAENVDGRWATAQTLGIETLLASPTHSDFVNLDYLDCRSSSCELSIQLSTAAPPHAEARLLGELGRDLPTARIQRDGDQLVIVASRS